MLLVMRGEAGNLLIFRDHTELSYCVLWQVPNVLFHRGGGASCYKCLSQMLQFKLNYNLHRKPRLRWYWGSDLMY